MRSRFEEVFDNVAGQIVEFDEGGQFSKKIVILSYITIILFTVTVFFFSWHYRPVPDSLIYSFFGTMGVELGSLAGIRIAKNRVNNLQH